MPIACHRHSQADHLPTDARGSGASGHQLAVYVIQVKGDTARLTVPACDPEAVGGPAQVSSDGNDLTALSTFSNPPRSGPRRHSAAGDHAVDVPMVQQWLSDCLSSGLGGAPMTAQQPQSTFVPRKCRWQRWPSERTGLDQHL